jgi:hypothetical protein
VRLYFGKQTNKKQKGLEVWFKWYSVCPGGTKPRVQTQVLKNSKAKYLHNLGDLSTNDLLKITTSHWVELKDTILTKRLKLT